MRVAVDEKQITVDGKKKWLYAAVDTDSKLLLDIEVFSRRGTDPASAFLHRLTTKHEVADTEFLVDASGHLTALARRELSGQLNSLFGSTAELALTVRWCNWFSRVFAVSDRISRSDVVC